MADQLLNHPANDGRARPAAAMQHSQVERLKFIAVQAIEVYYMQYVFTRQVHKNFGARQVNFLLPRLDKANAGHARNPRA